MGSENAVPRSCAVPLSRPGPDASAGIVVDGPAGAGPGARPGAGGSGNPDPAFGGGPGSPGAPPATACPVQATMPTSVQTNATPPARSIHPRYVPVPPEILIT
jgi:hypothetical protein